MTLLNQSKCKFVKYLSVKNVQTLRYHVPALMKNAWTLMDQRLVSVKILSYGMNLEIVTSVTHLGHFHGNVLLVSFLNVTTKKIAIMAVQSYRW